MGNYRGEANHQMLEEARRTFASSERVLNFLRMQTATAIKPATDQEIIEWFKNIRTKRCGGSITS